MTTSSPASEGGLRSPEAPGRLPGTVGRDLGAGAREPSPPARPATALVHWLRRWSLALRSGITAVAAWVLTVAPLLTVRNVPWVAKVAAAVALFGGVSAPAVAPRYPTVARHLGISVFVAGSVATWLIAAGFDALPVSGGARDWLGAVAWALHGVSWAQWGLPSGAQPPGEPGVGAVRAHALPPRRQLPLAAVLCAVASAAAALVVVVVGWHVDRSERMVLAFTLATAAALGLLATGAALAMLHARLPEHDRSTHPGGAEPVRLVAPRAWMLLVALVVVVALLYGVWR